MIGTRIAHYEVTAKIGEGGMGEVYRATDTKLHRDVALKILSGPFASDAQRMGRFQREAEVLASLSHANIGAIFGIEDAGESKALVLELIEGPTLADRIAQGPVPLEDALPIALQIAEALEAAHEKGIIHRDLKPANIKVAPDGRVKVLDFGLAKALEVDPQSSPDTTHSPTLTADATRAGMLLGTAAYMSPEQVRGRPVDRRADLWAFGVVLWEMLCGRRLFAGETVSDTLAAVLREDIDFSKLPDDISPALRRLLRRCLARDAAERLHHVADARLELVEAQREGPPVAVSPGDARKRRPLAPILAAGAAALAGFAAGSLLAPSASNTDRVRVVSMQPLTDLPGHQHSPSLDREGRRLLYVSEDGGDDDIFLQRVSGERPINLTGDSPAHDFQPAFSPDGERIAFASDREGGGIFVMGASGESPVRVAPTGYAPSWSPDGQWLLFTTEYVEDVHSRGRVSPLIAVRPDGSGLRPLGEWDGVGASWSPGGQRIAFWSNEDGQRDILTVAFEDRGDEVRIGERIPVTADPATDWNPVWSADGRWLYFLSDRGGSSDLWRVGIDQTTGEVSGEPTPVTSGVARLEQIALSANRVVATVSRSEGQIRAYDFDRRLRRLGPLLGLVRVSAGPFFGIDVSPDSQWLVGAATTPDQRIFIQRLDGTEFRWLTDGRGRNRGPIFSPDGQWIAFYSNRGGSYQVWAVRPNGTGLRQVSDFEEIGTGIVVWGPGGELSYGEEEDTGLVPQTVLDSASLDALEEPLDEEDFELLEGTQWARFIDWSPDRRRVVCYTYLEDENRIVMGVYDVAERSVRPAVFLPTANPLLSKPLWIDDRVVAVWDPNRRLAVLWDTEANATLPLEAPGPATYVVPADGQTMIVNLTVTESDIWALELGQ